METPSIGVVKALVLWFWDLLLVPTRVAKIAAAQNALASRIKHCPNPGCGKQMVVRQATVGTNSTEMWRYECVNCSLSFWFTFKPE